MNINTLNIFITGGSGTLGKAIARRRKQEGWNGKLTVYSTDEHKHAIMRKEYPDVNFVCGDIRNRDTLYNAMVGHDLVIHAAAVKVIPVSEYDSIDTFDVNVNGSINVFSSAIRANVSHVIAISTDKAAHPANAYGASKMMMEKALQEYARLNLNTQFHLVRYGNVLESTGSVIETWKNAIRTGNPIRITSLDMTRFWLSPTQAVDLVLKALDLKGGHIYVAKMPALSIGKLALYCAGEMTNENDVKYTGVPMIGDSPVEYIPLRPGEKENETLLTLEELDFASDCGDYFDLRPTTSPRNKNVIRYIPYSSDTAPELTHQQLDALLAEV